MARFWTGTGALISAMMGLGWSVPALADAPKDTHLDLLARTSLPVFLGGRLQAEVPRRIRVGLNIGWLPPPYLELYNRASGARFWETVQPNSAITLALDGSFVGGFDVGWRPLKRYGLVFDGGYQFVALNGDQAGALRPENPGVTPSSDAWTLNITETLHLVTASIGYEYVHDDRLIIRADVGGAFTVGTTTHVGSRNTTRVTPSQVALREAEVARRYEQPLNTPTLTVSIGWRIF